MTPWIPWIPGLPFLPLCNKPLGITIHPLENILLQSGVGFPKRFGKLYSRLLVEWENQQYLFPVFDGLMIIARSKGLCPKQFKVFNEFKKAPIFVKRCWHGSEGDSKAFGKGTNFGNQAL